MKTAKNNGSSARPETENFGGRARHDNSTYERHEQQMGPAADPAAKGNTTAHSIFGPTPVDTELEPAVTFRQEQVAHLISEVAGPEANPDWIKQIVANHVLLKSENPGALEQACVEAHEAGLNKFDSSEKGKRLVELERLVPFLDSLAESNEKRLGPAREARDRQPVFWTKLVWRLNKKNWLSIFLGSLLIAVLATLAVYTVDSESANAGFIFEQSGVFDDYPEEVAAAKIGNFVFVLIVGFAAALKAPFLVLTPDAFRTYKRRLAKAFCMLGFCTVLLFGLKTGDAVEASSNGFENVKNAEDAPSQNLKDWIPNAALPVCTLILAALTLNGLLDFLIYFVRWQFDTIVCRDTTGQKTSEWVCQLATNAGGEVGIAGKLSGHSNALAAERELYACECVRNVKALWGSLNHELRETIRKFPAVLLIAVISMTAGCSSPSDNEHHGSATVISSGSISGRSAGANTEWFVIVGPGMPKASLEGAWHELGKIVLDGSASGDRICVMRGPDLRPVTSIVIPNGSRGRRERDKNVRSAMAKLVPLLLPQDVPADASAQVNLPMLASAIAASRQTDFSCRVIIIGDPVHIDAQPGWSCEGGYTPNDASMDDPHSPWGNQTRFPTGGKVSWLAPSMTWGKGPEHRESLLRYIKLYVQERGGQLSRMTPDPETAFLFASPQFLETIAKRDDVAGMRFTHREGQRPNDAPIENTIVVPVNPVMHTPQKETLSEQFDGLSRFELESVLEAGKVDEPTDIIIVRDDSASMSHAREINNRTLTTVARTLPLISPSLEVCVIAYAGENPAVLPFTLISPVRVDSGQSLLKLTDFLKHGHADGGKADMLRALNLASSRFTRSGRRQMLMVIGDTVEESLDGDAAATLSERQLKIAEVVTDWVDEEPQLRSFFAVYIAGEGRQDTPTSQFLRELCLTSPRCTYSDNPSTMLELVLSGIHAE